MPDDTNEQIAQRLPGVAAFRRSLTRESDRGCALFAAAYLDEALLALLRASFVDHEPTIREFTGTNGPLASFSARIDACFLLGLLSEAERRELHLVRKIRNDFAHKAEPIDFEHSPIADRCRQLQYSVRETDSSARSHFIGAVCAVLGLIHGAEIAAHQPSVIPDLPLDSSMRDRLESFADSVRNKIAAALGGAPTPADVNAALERSILEALLELDDDGD